MKKLLYALTGLCLLAGAFTGCEKPNETGEEGGTTNGGGSTPTEQWASIQGKVTDKETGNPLEGVTIELQPTGLQVQTAEDGTYILDNLKVAVYALRAQKEGYDEYIKEAIQLIANQPLLLDIEMEEEAFVPQEPELQENYMETVFGLNMEMVYVKGGTFEMGATAEQENEAYDDEKPVRTIRLDGYHIGKYEVTQAQWKAVMGTEPLYFKGDNLPVEQVSWADAQEFCQKLSEATGKKYVLPTEAQWEYAARGGNQSQHYKYAGSNDIGEVACYYSNRCAIGLGTRSVGSMKANELGIYDMSGNVWEWCSDWYASSYDENDTENPQGPAEGPDRVSRGGSWSFDGVDCRVSYRFNDNPDNRSDDLGFRVACSSK